MIEINDTNTDFAIFWGTPGEVARDLKRMQPKYKLEIHPLGAATDEKRNPDSGMKFAVSYIFVLVIFKPRQANP